MEPSTTITTWAIVKNFLYIPAAFFLAGLNSESYVILTFFMVLDFFLGIARAGYINGGASIKSYKMIAGFVTKILVTCVPLVVVWAGRGAMIDLRFLAQWSVGILILSQAYSVLGHINAIRVGKDIAEFDMVSALLANLRGIFENIIKGNHYKK